MEKYTMLWIGRINIVKMNILPKAICIQCNPYQATNGIFHRTRTNNFTICVETHNLEEPKQSFNFILFIYFFLSFSFYCKVMSQSNLEKEEWNWRNQPS